jgi:serine/threonine protein kinase
MAVRQMLVADRYRLLEPVGAGGMGRVWLARDEMLHRDVAVKEIVPPSWMSDAEQHRMRDRTLREARSAARLNHPHVVRIYDVVHAEGLSWIVMEYVPSRSLHQVLNDEGPYEPAVAARIGLAVLDALAAAHRAGVLHRDVKPHNVLIGTDGRVVLTDFGLATFVGDGSVTAPGLIVGSPQYVSPERARDGASTVESDLWSLGATLYAAVEGHSPYARETAMATLAALATEPPDPPVRAGSLAAVLDGLLRYEPASRLTVPEIERRLRMIVFSDPQEIPFLPRQDRPGTRRKPSGQAFFATPSVPGTAGPEPGGERVAPAASGRAGVSDPTPDRPSGPPRGTATVTGGYPSQPPPAWPPIPSGSPARPAGPARPSPRQLRRPGGLAASPIADARRPAPRPAPRQGRSVGAPGEASGTYRAQADASDQVNIPPGTNREAADVAGAAEAGSGTHWEETRAQGEADVSPGTKREAARAPGEADVSPGTKREATGVPGEAEAGSGTHRVAGSGQAATPFAADPGPGVRESPSSPDAERHPAEAGSLVSSGADHGSPDVDSPALSDSGHSAADADSSVAALHRAGAGSATSEKADHRAAGGASPDSETRSEKADHRAVGGASPDSETRSEKADHRAVGGASPDSETRSETGSSEAGLSEAESSGAGDSASVSEGPETGRTPRSAGQAVVLAGAGAGAGAGADAGAAGRRSRRRWFGRPAPIRVTPARLTVTGLVVLLLGGSLVAGYVAELTGARPQVVLPSPLSSASPPTPAESPGHQPGATVPVPTSPPFVPGVPDPTVVPPASPASSGPATTDSVAPAVRPFSPLTCDAPSPASLPLTPLRGATRGVNGWTLQTGWSYFSDGSGFHIAVPDGWTHQRIGTTHCFRSPRGNRVMTVDTGRDPAVDPLTASRDAEHRLAASGALTGYELIGLAAVPLLNRAADWEYRHQASSGAARHTVIRWFLIGGKAYVLGWSTPEKTWKSDLSRIQMVRSTFYSSAAR